MVKITKKKEGKFLKQKKIYRRGLKITAIK